VPKANKFGPRMQHRFFQLGSTAVAQKRREGQRKEELNLGKEGECGKGGG